MKHAISVKLDTLTCTRLDFEEILRGIGNYLYVNDSLWLIECTAFYAKSPENVFYEYFEKVTTENSHILIFQLSNEHSYHGELPNEATSFLDS